MAGEALVGVAPKGKGVLSPWEIPQVSTHAQRLSVQASWAVRPSRQACARAWTGAHTPAWRKKVWGEGIKENDRWGLLDIETEEKEEGWRLVGRGVVMLVWAGCGVCWAGRLSSED
jgi:hypothetical protein